MSGLSYKELSIPHFKEAFDMIDEVFTRCGIRSYLIGVTALDLTLLERGIRPERGTKDIDFAIMVASRAEYEAVIDSLVFEGFARVKAPWTVYHRGFGLVVDILPFGEIEQHHTAQFNDRYSDLHVIGLREVLAEPIEAQVGETLVRMPSLHGMVLLKLIAWGDRPEERNNDLYDILRVIDHYFDIHFDDIVESHFDTFPEDTLDRLLVAAQVLGRKARHFLRQNPRLESRVRSILGRELNNAGHSSIARRWAQIRDCDISYAHTVLGALHKGLTEP